MASSSRLLLLLQLLCFISVGRACFCDRYPWGSWSACSRTCNYGTQQRNRNFQKNDGYYWRSSCSQLCKEVDTRACNEQACPIDCLLTEYGPWSGCSPCTRKQFRTRAVLRPSQFGGSACSVELTEERPCLPSTECQLAAVDCRDNFRCDNGRCINTTLTCNGQNDCVDNSDERDCVSVTKVCPTERRVTPGADLVGNGFDALAGEPRGAVLDNTFMGGVCNLKRVLKTLLYHRIPHNFERVDIKAAEVEDFSTEPQQLQSEPVTVETSSPPSHRITAEDQFILFYIPYFFFFNGRSSFSSSTYTEAFKASKQTDSKFFRVHQVLPVSKFKLKNPGDLVLSQPFLQFLHALPLQYNYAVYREIFQRFGTHYYDSGTLGGHYDLLYQYNREELKSSGQTDEHVTGCLRRDTSWSILIYTHVSSEVRCSADRMTEKYEGSYIKAAEKSFSMVKGGRVREASALAWERHGPSPDRTSYKNWAKTVLESPAVVDYKLGLIINLVRGLPCAATKRRHLRKALLQYLEEFDTCKCAPCPNNARPVLSGTECKCVCQTGTYGTSCERRAPDYTSEQVDGYWSCWAPWSSCDGSMKRHRRRRCDNPAPLRGGKPCEGPERQEDTCHISLFKKQETCDNDDDFTVGWGEGLPPGVQGCLSPQIPDNSFLRKAKRYYNFGEDEEFVCYTGFEMEGYQLITCLADGTWTSPDGRCIRKVCLPPDIPDDMTLYPHKDEYKEGESVGLNCNRVGLMPLPRGRYRCRDSLSWEPPVPAHLRCTNDEPFVPESRCGLGEKLQGSQCVCVERERCLSQPETLCILNTDVNATVPMSICSFHAGRCHGDPLFFVHEGSCDEVDASKLEWVRFRAEMSSRSSVHESCNLDTCYEWETCSGPSHLSKKCECKVAADCPRDAENMLCVKLNRRKRSLNLCSVSVFKCLGYVVEIVNEGVCQSR